MPGKVPKAGVDLFLQKLLWEKAAHDNNKVTDIIRLKVSVQCVYIVAYRDGQNEVY